MTTEAKVMRNGEGERINRSILWAEIKRFEDSQKNPLWRFVLEDRGFGAGRVELDANPDMLHALARFATKAAETVRTDGGRES